jgi:phage tail sheath protein FI
VTRLLRIAALGIAVYAVATKGGRERLKRAQEAYNKEVASGARPIEAVGTAVAAFVGLADNGPSETVRSPGVVLEEVPEPPRPINLPGTSTASRVDSDPETP